MRAWQWRQFAYWHAARRRGRSRPGRREPKGKVHLDVVVTDTAGKPVSGLQQQDFKLLDDGSERGVASFAAYDGVNAKADAPVQIILVVDCVNNGFVEMGSIHQGLLKFLRQNNGRLAQPTTIVQFAPSGVEVLSTPSTDGNGLAGIVEQIGAATKATGMQNFSLSLKALSTLVNQEANQPGRKLLVWLGPGWPTPVPSAQVVTAIDQRDRLADYYLMVQLAKAMQEGRIELYGGYEGTDFYMRDYLKPVRKPSEAVPADLALAVLATKSGGHDEVPVDRNNAVTDLLNNVVAEAGTFYSLWFDPPQAKAADEFHDLKIVLDKPGLAARTITGYYDEPEYFQTDPKQEKTVIAQPPPIEEPNALSPVIVAQLVELVHNSKGKRDSGVAKDLERLQLTERLSTPKLTMLSADLPGAKSKAALMAVADASVFLEPPAGEIPQKSLPDAAEQKQIMSLAVDYLKMINPKLPDFSAKRLTTSFEEVWTQGHRESGHRDVALHPAGEYKATVYYRGSKEVVHEEGKREQGLITQGTFGPILNTVIVDAAHGSMQWSRWEAGPNGPMAVFQFRVTQAESHYQTSSPGLPGIESSGAMAPTAYHGEIGIDAASGTILRLVLEAEPDPSSAVTRADIMVEYGAVGIGGKVYTCPLRSVSMSTGRTPQTFTALGPTLAREVTRLDDVVFSDYHVFRSDFRIVPYVSEDSRPEPENEKTITVQQAAIEEPGAPRLVTVAQLADIVGKANDKHDREAAKEIEHLQLTERLSSPKLAMLSAELQGAKSKTALMAVADASVFLGPPASEVPQKAAPDIAEQTQMMAQVVDYLKKTLPKLPDFYARRFTTSFEEVWTPKDEKGTHNPDVLHPAGNFKATVYYRGGKEVAHEEGAQEHGLITRGTFGPILGTVIGDAAQSATTRWSRWEEGSNGPMAAFRFQVSRTESHYKISETGESGVTDTTAYHGEIGIDPGSGTILRLLLEADPALGSSIERADIMVEYGPVEIGGKTYTCPVRSVSYSVGTLSVPVSLDVATSWERESARLNDVAFSDYHVFRSEMQIVQ